MRTKQELLNIIKKQLAIEYNCSVNDFSSPNNIVTVSRNIEEKRHYIDGTFFFQMVTFGDNVVITANEYIHDWLKEYTKDKKGHWLFEHNNLIEIDKKLKDCNKKLGQTHHMFLSYREILPKDINLKTKWFENEETHQFYDTKMFPNAFCTKYNPKRPDVLAVAAYDEDKIIAMAGCYADTPFYGTSLSNLYSWGIALNSGFTPVWIEIETIGEEKIVSTNLKKGN